MCTFGFLTVQVIIFLADQNDVNFAFLAKIKKLLANYLLMISCYFKPVEHYVCMVFVQNHKICIVPGKSHYIINPRNSSRYSAIAEVNAETSYNFHTLPRQKNAEVIPSVIS